MHRPPRPASALAVAVAIAVAAVAPVAPVAPASAAGECGTHRSETDPPATIRVLRTASGAVDTVDFRTYVKNVLSREWISSWTTESLRSGAMAVKNYAWYQVIHWRGYTNSAGECFDIFDSTHDQHYDPSRPTYPAMAVAVDATWGTLAHKGGRIFATYYNAGAAHEACGANANGWQMFQWGTQACGLAGMSADQILAVYYPGVAVIAAPPAVGPPPATPTPAPTPTPAATLTPAPSTPLSPGPAPTQAPAPTPVPTVVPAAPPEPVATPGGGQVGLVAPPPPPPPNPEPIIVSVAAAAEGTVVEAAAAGAPTIGPAAVDIRTMRDHAVLRFEQAVDDAAAGRSAPRPRTMLSLATRLLIVRLILDRAAPNLATRLPRGG